MPVPLAVNSVPLNDTGCRRDAADVRSRQDTGMENTEVFWYQFGSGCKQVICQDIYNDEKMQHEKKMARNRNRCPLLAKVSQLVTSTNVMIEDCDAMC